MWFNNDNTLFGISSEVNDGVNFLIARSRAGNTAMNLYSEMASMYKEPPGGSAMASKRTSRRYALWLNNTQDLRIENFFVHGSRTAAPDSGEWIRIGNSSSLRSVVLKGVYFGSGSLGNWTGVTFVDVYKDLLKP